MIGANLSADELTEIDARSDAMVARAEGYEGAIFQHLAAISTLHDTEHGLDMLVHLANVIALEQLRCAALGIGDPPTWEATLRRYRVLTRETIQALKQNFRNQEASN